MPLPSFLVIGAQKSGTTWLYRMLSQHPEIFTTDPKGLYFFCNADRYVKGDEWYRAHFDGSTGYKAAGEFTPNYFDTDPDDGFSDGLSVPARAAKLVPNAKIILALRNPVDRAVSAYYHHIKAKRLTTRDSLSSVAHRYGIRSMGCYDRHLEQWLEHYDRQNILVLVYEEDIQSSRQQTLARVYDFLGVDTTVEGRFSGYHYNPRRSHLALRLQSRSERLAVWTDRVVPARIRNHRRFEVPVQAHELEELREFYRPHNRRLSEMLDRNLPWT